MKLHKFRSDRQHRRTPIKKNKDAIEATCISPTAKKFDHMIQWDFHEIKDEWRGRVDFTYSNTLDHSVDPVMRLDRWAESLREGGLCFLEWSPWHDEDHSTPDGPFGPSLEEHIELLSKNFETPVVIEPGTSDTDIYERTRTLVVANKPSEANPA